MAKELSVLLLELVELLLVGVGSAVVAAVGLVAESRAMDALLGGDPVLAAWLLFMGAVALYLGVYLLGYEGFIPRLRGLRTDA